MRLLPSSLFGRLTLILLAGLTAAQLLSASILLRDRGQALYRSVRADMVGRTAEIVQVLDALDPEERRRLLPLLGTRDTRIGLAQRPADLPEPDPESVAAADWVEGRLRERLAPGTEVRVSLRGALVDGPPPGMPMRHMMGPGGGPGPWAFMHGLHAMAQTFHIQVRLADGTWVRFERGVPRDLFQQPPRLLATLLVLLLGVVLVGLVAVRWVVRPLGALRDAADALGRDINRPPLAESGPLEVRATARAFNTMQARLKGYIEDRARILAAVSHDLKTPLTRLRLRSDLLDDEELRVRFQQDLDDMEAMVGATLDFMRGTESREPSSALDLMALLESLRDDAREAGGRVDLEGRVERPVQGRPLALKRCLTNLVDNAVRYAGAAEVQVDDDGRQVRVRVLDRGPGIPEESLERVFDPFFRLESSRARHTGGTGLGLGIARNIARGHGGDLTLRNREGGGLCVELTLPR